MSVVLDKIDNNLEQSIKLPLATLSDLRFCKLQSPKQLIKSLTVILSPFTIKSTTLCCLRTLKPLADNVDASFSRTCLERGTN